MARMFPEARALSHSKLVRYHVHYVHIGAFSSRTMTFISYAFDGNALTHEANKDGGFLIMCMQWLRILVTITQ